MKNIIKNSLANSLAVVGSMVGVGLASGREIVVFFAKYGYWSICFCLCSAIMFFVLILASGLINTKNTHKNKKRKIEENALKNDVKTSKIANKTRTARAFDIILYICQISICSAMFAGINSLLDTFNIAVVVKFLILLSVLFVSILILNYGKNIVFSLNSLLSVVLIFFSFLVFIVGLVSDRCQTMCKVDFSVGAIFNSILYAGMNVLTIYPLVVDRAKYIKSKKEMIITSALSSFFILFVLVVFCLCILLFGGDYLSDDMIMLSISKSFSELLGIIHFGLIAFSIFTTLLSTAFGAGVCFSGAGKWLNALNLTTAFCLGFVGFSNLIEFVYPALGLVFIVYIILVVLDCLVRKKRVDEK